MSDPCPDCGANRDLVGIKHNCRTWDQKLIAAAKEARTMVPMGQIDWAKCPNCVTLHTRITELEELRADYFAENTRLVAEIDEQDTRIADLEARLVTFQKKGADRVKKHRAKKKQAG